MIKIPIQSQKRKEIIDITSQIKNIVKNSNIKEGVCLIYTPHTTSAITINENYDEDVKDDLIEKLDQLIPYSKNYKHIEGNSDSHIKASIIGNSRITIINNNEIVLGQWEGIFFCEFDGPRTREVYVKIIYN